MKRCPFCAEQIQVEAIKCRFCGEWLNDGHEGSPRPNGTPAIRVTYEVTGKTLGVDIEYRDADSKVVERLDQSVPWSYAFDARSGQVVSLRARNKELSAFGYVVCSVYMNGALVRSETAAGRYATSSLELVVPLPGMEIWNLSVS